MERVLKEFAALNRIPRPSGHEDAVVAYIKERGEGLGYHTVVDEGKNVIIEVPATPGYEKTPLLILQAHTDMVCVGNENYNPFKDPIVTEIQGDMLKAKGTSLGADDGIGVAMILALISSPSPHGPLRCIFTADEEEGMGGAIALEEKYLEGKYLINLDWEDVTSVGIGCAGCTTVTYYKHLEKENRSGVCYSLEIKGLRGGHSGSEIHENRGNAISLLGQFFAAFSKEKMDYFLADIKGGSGANVIASQCKAKIILAEKDVPILKKVVDCIGKILKEENPFEDNLAFVLTEDDSKEGFSKEDSLAIGNFLSQCPQGVAEKSNMVLDGVATSNNIGIINTVNDVSITLLFRSNDAEKSHVLINNVAALATSLGFEMESDGGSPVWEPKEGSPLETLAASIYAAQEGKELKRYAIHAGLECGYFAKKNPNLAIIAMGPTVLWCHSIDEVLCLSSLPKAMSLLEGMVKEIK